MPSTHVDRIYIDPLTGRPPRLEARYRSIDDPRIDDAERYGQATYVLVSDPHTLDDCPFGHGDIVEPPERLKDFNDYTPILGSIYRQVLSLLAQAQESNDAPELRKAMELLLRAGPPNE